MDFKSLIPLLEKSSPILGAIIGGPAGSVVASLVASVFGGDPTNPDELAKRITEDPDANLKLQQLELHHKEAMLLLQAKYSDNDLQDRINARAREITMIQLGKKEWILHFLAIINSLGFFTIIGLLFFSSININQREAQLINIMLGTWLSVYTGINAYYYGSVHAHANKNQNG